MAARCGGIGAGSPSSGRQNARPPTTTAASERVQYVDTSAGARTLEALHLAAASRAGAPALRLVAFDVSLAQVARDLGWTVVGA